MHHTNPKSNIALSHGAAWWHISYRAFYQCMWQHNTSKSKFIRLIKVFGTGI